MLLRTSAEQARKLILTIPNKRCTNAIDNHWKVDVHGRVCAQSALWLFCWAKTGMGSEKARIAAAWVFDQVMPIGFADFDRAVDHQYARLARYTPRDIQGDLERKLASVVSRVDSRS